MTEEQKEKYANFLDKVSEILGLNKPIDILRLCAVTDEYFKPIKKRIAELENENKRLKEGLAVGSTFNKALNSMNKALNSMNKALEEESDKYRNIVFDKMEQLDKAKEIIKDYMIIVKGGKITACGVPEENRCINALKLNEQAEQFLKEIER